MAEECSQLRVLRLFGLDRQQVTAVLRDAAEKGCPGLRLGEKDGEYAICVQAKAPTEEQAAALCDQWQNHLKEAFGPALYSTGGEDLAEITTADLDRSHKLLVAADETTGSLLNHALLNAKCGRAVYDFGRLSYAHPRGEQFLNDLPSWARKAEDAPTRATGRSVQAMRLSEADFALTRVPAPEGGTLLLLCSKKGSWIKALPRDAEPGLAVNWMLDMARRAALGLPMLEGVQPFKLSKPVPVPILPEEPEAEAEQPPEPTRQMDPVRPPEAPVQQAEEPARPAAKPVPEVPAKPAATARPAPPAVQPAPAAAPVKQAAPAPHAVNMAQAVQAQPALSGKSQTAARTLYDLEADSFEEPEPPRPRRHGLRIFLCAVLVGLIAGAAAVAVWLWQNPAAAAASGPAYRGYGTADFDADATAYVQQAQTRDSAVQAYLALSGSPGTLVYSNAPAQQPAPGAVQAAGPEDSAAPQVACFSVDADLTAPHHNALLYCPPQAIGALAELDQHEALKANCGFTLYEAQAAHRYKVVSVFYWDPAEQGPGAFDLPGLQDLTNYADYMDFVLGIKARSLYELAVNIEDGDSFVTLITESPELPGVKLAVVGRKQREGENARLETSAVTASATPLYTARQYSQRSEPMPALEPLNEYWGNWYETQGLTASDNQEEQGMPEDDLSLDDLMVRIEQAKQEAQQVANATPVPVPTSAPESNAQSGGQGTMPEIDVPNVTPAPVPAPDGGASSGSEGRHDGPDIDGGSSAPTTTLKVTMNGTRQEMDAVECLAMIAQNELGYNQPAEAYKAQAVAAHSWILTQGSYPQVSGVPPTQEVREIVASVANQVLTYKGSVAFTPYFASAAYGTCPSTEVWGSSRPYLVAVDSPWDEHTARNWKTTREFTRDEVAGRASEVLGIDLNAYSEDPSAWMGDLQKNSGGYVLNMRIGDTTISGGTLRTKVLRDIPGRKNLRSSAFDIAYDADRGVFVFTVLGYGHGCGMSQMGAVGYAREGASYTDILSHYYPGTVISPI